MKLKRIAHWMPRFSVKLMLLLSLLAAICFAAWRIQPRDDQALAAVHRSDVDRVRWLATMHPKSIASNRLSDSLLHDVIERRTDEVELVQAILLAQPNLGFERGSQGTPLRLAMRLGQLDVAQALIGAGALDHGGRNWSPVHEAIRLPAAERKTLLPAILTNGAELGWLDSLNESALTVLCRRSLDDDSIALLIRLHDAGANINEVDANGDPPLVPFVRNCEPTKESDQFLRAMILMGADLRLRNNLGQGPLFLAARQAILRARRHWDVLRQLPLEDWEDCFVQTLLRNGADDEVERAKLDFLLRNPETLGLSSVRDILLAVRITDERARRNLHATHVWISSQKELSVAIHVGNPFATGFLSKRPANGKVLVVPHAAGRWRNNFRDGGHEAPIVPPSRWTDPRIEFGPGGQTMKCSIANHWMTLDTISGRWTRGVLE